MLNSYSKYLVTIQPLLQGGEITRADGIVACDHFCKNTDFACAVFVEFVLAC
jgi:hypothetical protein